MDKSDLSSAVQNNAYRSSNVTANLLNSIVLGAPTIHRRSCTLALHRTRNLLHDRVDLIVENLAGECLPGWKLSAADIFLEEVRDKWNADCVICDIEDRPESEEV